MNPRIRKLSRNVFTAVAALSLLFCIPAAALSLFSDHLHRKQLRVGHFELLCHHDIVIISWGPIDFVGVAQNQWSLDASWIGLDGDLVHVSPQRQVWFYTLNVTQLGLVGITAVLPGIWAFIYFWKKNKEEAERFPI